MTENQAGTAHKVLVAVTALSLWLTTSALALVEIIVVRALVLRVYGRFFAGRADSAVAYAGGAALSIWIMIPLAILAIAVLIGGADYHSRRLGQPASWKVFSRTIAVELSILVLALFI